MTPRGCTCCAAGTTRTCSGANSASASAPGRRPPYGQAANRIVVPLELNGEIVGYQARRVDEEVGGDDGSPKWWNPPGTPKSQVLYNCATARTYSMAVVCEGITDVWRVGPCAVGLFGLNMSPEQERLLATVWHGGTIVMLLDNDGAANPAAQRQNRQCRERLRRYFRKVIEVRLPEETDSGDLSRAGVWSLIRAADDRQGVELPLDELANVIPHGGSADPTRAACGVEVQPGEVAARLLEQITGAAASTGGSPEERLAADGLTQLFHEIEYPAAVVAGAMRAHGVGVDLPLLEELEFELGVRLGLLNEEIAATAGRAVNPLSRGEVASVLRERVSASGVRGNRGDGARLADLVLRYQELHRAATIVTNLLSRTDRRTGRVHCALDSLGTATGRFTCEAPPLHSLPGELRDLIVAPPGHLIVEADFSQIELRVLAHFSEDRGLLAAFHDGIDLHRRTAALALGVPEVDVSDDQRNDIGKAVNFGIVYGQTPYGLAAKLGINEDEAGSFLATFFEAHPGVRAWIEEIEEGALRDGYVTTLYGRRRQLPAVWSDNRAEQARGLRQAVNTVIQGTAAEINKIALARLNRELGAECRLMLTVHDAVLAEVPRNRADELSVRIGCLMEELPPGFRVPLKVALGVGDTWGECKRAARSG